MATLRPAARRHSALPDQQRLMEAARSGDRDALATLYSDHSGHALSYARTLTRTREDAEDLVAEAFARTFAKLVAGGGPEVSFVAYLRTTMRNTAAAQPDREYPVSELPDIEDENALVYDIDRLDDIRRMRRALGRLDGASRRALVLRYVAELPPAEVSRRLGLRASAASMRYARARDRLRELYLDEGEVSTEAAE